jgi:hypothetical protein
LVGDGKWVYHNFSRKVRDSDLFNTAVRGQISLVQNEEPVAETEVVEVPGIEAPIPETQEQEEQASWPGPTLGQS